MKSPKIIAEIGCNHKGDMAIAKEMIMTAATYCKVDVVKFQKRCNKELLTPEEYNAPHPHPENSYGKTYGEHREFLEFNLDQHRQLQEWCKEFGVEYHLGKGNLHAASQSDKSAFRLQFEQRIVGISVRQLRRRNPFVFRHDYS